MSNAHPAADVAINRGRDACGRTADGYLTHECMSAEDCGDYRSRFSGELLVV